MSIFFFFNDTATTEIYTLSLHDALPICHEPEVAGDLAPRVGEDGAPLLGRAGLDVDEEDTAPAQGEGERDLAPDPPGRSEEHTSELQSQSNLVCRLLLEKKKKKKRHWHK